MRLHLLIAAALVSAIGIAKDVIKPDGTENLGFLEVKLPELADKTLQPHAFGLSHNGQGFGPGVALRLPAGQQCISLTSRYIQQRYCDIKIEKKKTTTLVLGALHVKWDTSVREENLRVDLGTQSGIATNLQSNTGTPDGKRPFIVLPFEFSHTYTETSIEPFRVKVGEGEVKTIDITPKDVRVRLVVEHAKAEFPDALPAHGYHNREYRHFVVIASKQYSTHPEPAPTLVNSAINNHGRPDMEGVVSYAAYLPTKTEQTFYAFPLGAKSNLKFGFVVNGTAQYVESAKPGETYRFRTKRIDVDDVLVTTEKGATYYVTGTCSLKRKNPKSGLLEAVFFRTSVTSTMPVTFNTKHGLSVSPGVYELVVNFATKEGRDQRKYDLDLTN